MVSLSGVTAAQVAPPPARAVGNVPLSHLVSDQSSQQAANATVSQTTQQLDSDQQPRGAPAAIAADHEAVKAAQQAVQQASAKLQADRSQTALVNVLA